MFLFAVLLVASIDQLIADPRKCTKEDFCRPVPPEVCENSRCLPVDFSDLSEIGKNAGDAYTWNIGQKWLLGYGAKKWDILIKKEYGKTSQTITFPYCSKQICNSSANMTWVWYGEPDPYSGRYTILPSDRAGDTYENCFTYFEPGHAFVHRSCRVDPPSPPGQACATIYAVEIARGNCDREPFMNHLQELKVDFGEVTVDCL